MAISDGFPKLTAQPSAYRSNSQKEVVFEFTQREECAYRQDTRWYFKGYIGDDQELR